MPAKPKPAPATAIGPDRAPIRGWRSWGDRPMPVLRMRRRAPAWLLVPAGPRAKTGRRPGDESDDSAEPRGCHVGKVDALLERLHEVHTPKAREA